MDFIWNYSHSCCLFVAIAVINKFAGTSYSAIGIVAGALSGLTAFIINSVFFWINVFISFAEFFTNVLDHPVYSVKKLFFNLATAVLNNLISMTKDVMNLLLI